MPPEDGSPVGQGVHASAVVIGGHALLITGRSGAGKSRLAAALVAASRPDRRIALVGDDRVLLRRNGGTFTVRPHPRIAGFIERRGLGLVATPWRASAPVAGVAALSAEAAIPSWLKNLPTRHLVEKDVYARVAAVLAWWPSRDARATPRAQFAVVVVSDP